MKKKIRLFFYEKKVEQWVFRIPIGCRIFLILPSTIME